LRLRTRQHYQRIGRHPLKFKGYWISADMRLLPPPHSKPSCRLGIAVGRRYGHAPQRNRFKRIVREAFRLSYGDFSFSFDIVVRPQPNALFANSQDVQKELLEFVQRIHPSPASPQQKASSVIPANA